MIEVSFENDACEKMEVKIVEIIPAGISWGIIWKWD